MTGKLPVSEAGSGRAARWTHRRGPDDSTRSDSDNGSDSLSDLGSDSSGRSWIGTLVLLVVAVALLLTFIRLPYFVFRPGSVQALSDRVTITRGERFDPVGEVYFTTVRQDSTVNGWEYLEARLKGSLTLVGEDRVLGGRSRDENRSFNMRLMRVSKSTAVAVALRHLGIDPIKATGVGMAEVVGPSTGLLTTDDVILSVDGVEVRVAMDLVHAIGGRAPGEVVSLEVEPVRGGMSRVVEVVLGEREDDPTIGFLGVVPQTRWEDVDDLPVDVLVNTGRVGGNSAGLALTLSILDLVTPGELTGGLRVATTGTIDIDGNVGPIGGIVQKVAAAEEAGIDLLLVPVTELAEAREHAGDLAVEGVSTLDDALAALARHGGESRDLVLPDG
jgi:PDZ domain-containing protein